MSNTDRFKFRVWDNLISRYWEEGTVQLGDDGQAFVLGMPDRTPEYLNDIIIEQCTGIRDKNEKLIYEGDIIKSPSQRRIGVVRWCGWNTDCLSGLWVVKCRKDKMPEPFSSQWEIIGNIHEPEGAEK